MRVQKMIEKVSPARKVDAARVECPPRKPRIAEAVQETMINTINTMINTRRRVGVNMA